MKRDEGYHVVSFFIACQCDNIVMEINYNI